MSIKPVIMHSDSMTCFLVFSERICIDFGVALSRVNVLLKGKEMRRFELLNFCRYRQPFRCVAAGGQRESRGSVEYSGVCGSLSRPPSVSARDFNMMVGCYDCFGFRLTNLIGISYTLHIIRAKYNTFLIYALHMYYESV